MSRTARTKAYTGLYHVIQRGVGKQILFEDAEDNQHLLHLLGELKKEIGFELHAYCLMENHFHILIRTDEELSLIMKRLGIAYAIYFNKKYERTGHVFQDRFKSEPINDRSYYFTVIRYILRNPQNANICSLENYKWSSYNDYRYTSMLTDTNLLLKMIGGKDAFPEFMTVNEDVSCMEDSVENSLSDKTAIDIIRDTLKLASGTQIQAFSRIERDKFLCRLKEQNLSIRQIERLTGISRGVIMRAKM